MTTRPNVPLAAEAAARRPFAQVPFDDLPEYPRVPHPYFEARRELVSVTSPSCGTVNTAIRTWGSGPPLLLVHGLMTTSYSWRYLLEPLGSSYTLIFPDLPGTGETGPAPTGCYKPEALAEWIGSTQRALGIRGCDVIGNSMAGYLCMRLALDDPQSMRRLVNLHSPGVPESRLYALDVLLRVPGVKRIISAYIARDPERFAHEQIHYYDETLKSREGARAYGAPISTPIGRAALMEYLHQTMSPYGLQRFVRDLARLRETGARFPVPTLLAYARQDPLVSPRIGQRLHELTGQPLAWMEHGSHFAHVDAVDELVPLVRTFLGSKDDSPHDGSVGAFEVGGHVFGDVDQRIG